MSKTEQRNQAKSLYVDQGKAGVEVAALVNISTTNFYRWVRRYGWKAQKESKLMEKKLVLLGLAVNRDDVLTEFKSFLNNKYPAIATVIEVPITEYLQSKN